MTQAENRPILITRPAGKADALLASLDALELPYVYQPLLTTMPVEVPLEQQSLLKNADGLVFVSLSSVMGLQQQLKCHTLVAPFYAVGSTTAALLASLSGKEVAYPTDQRSEGLLQLPVFQQVQGQHFVIVRGNGGRDLIEKTLLERGAKVSYVQSYKRVPLPLDGAQLFAKWREQPLQGILATSNEILQLLFELVPREGRAWLCEQQWILVSPRMHEAGVALGIPTQNILLSANANDESLLESIRQLRGNTNV